MSVAQGIKDSLASALADVGIEEFEVALEHPADLKNGDYSSGVALEYAKVTGTAPRALAEKIVAGVGAVEGVAKIEIAGAGFINFYLDSSALASAVGDSQKLDTWGRNELHSGKKVMVEYTDPNPFKEFHIGHLMSNAIGESLARLFEYAGAVVKRANYQGDVGPHVAKALWGLRKLSLDPHDITLLSKAYIAGAQAYESDHTVRDEINAINAKVYDRSDAGINELYESGKKTSLQHFEELYATLGTKFDFYFFESETAPKGVKIVKQNPKVFVESEGAIVFHGPHTRVFITSKGLPTYETKELGLAEIKAEKWPFDSSITITAHEQSGYFEVVLVAMREIFPDLAKKLTHVSHGMMRLPSGKMSSRTGDVITGESLLNELIEQAKLRAAESRADDKEKLARDVAVGAIKYQILKQASGRDIIFDRDRALSLEGDSGPYLQYAHARSAQLLERANSQGPALKIPQGRTLEVPESATELVRLLHRFPEVVERATGLLEPHIVTNYLLEIAARFNSWYAQVHILDGSSDVPHKVAIVAAVESTLKNGLWILGIPSPEKM